MESIPSGVVWLCGSICHYMWTKIFIYLCLIKCYGKIYFFCSQKTWQNHIKYLSAKTAHQQKYKYIELKVLGEICFVYDCIKTADAWCLIFMKAWLIMRLIKVIDVFDIIFSTCGSYNIFLFINQINQNG